MPEPGHIVRYMMKLPYRSHATIVTAYTGGQNGAVVADYWFSSTTPSYVMEACWE